jgi:glycosyltransferase involved in cell wall biosynthesis
MYSQNNNSNTNGISVVISTFNYKTLLKKTLDSLCQQTLSTDKYEVIVVDDGSSDGTDLVIDDYQDRINIRYFYQQDQGFRVSKVRNIGIDNARFKRTLFLDAGMGASPQLLRKHYDCMLQDNHQVVVGMSYGVFEFEAYACQQLNQILAQPDLGKALATMRLHTNLYDCRYQYLSSIDFDLSNTPVPWIVCWTGHVSCSTAVLRQIGGFDEWFTSWGGEDVELGIRLYQAGCPFTLLKGLESVHFPHQKDSDAKQKTANFNIDYIHSKHKLAATRMMKNHSWEQLLNHFEQLELVS